MTEKFNPHELELREKVVYINRVAKVVKGGRRFSFSAIVVVGDGNGHVGVGLGKANEVVNAIAKATEKAKKEIVRIDILNGTIPYEVYGKFGAGKVVLLLSRKIGRSVIGSLRSNFQWSMTNSI